MSEALLPDVQLVESVYERPPSAPEFRGGKAALVLLLMLVAQAFVGFVSVLLKLVGAAMSGSSLNDPAKVEATIGRVDGATLLISVVVSGAVTYLLARAWAWSDVRDSETGIGFRRARRRDLLLSAIGGFGLATSYLVICQFLFPLPTETPLGPLAQLAQSDGFSYIAWVILAVVLAPPLEEFLFRGLLLKGFSRSFGVAWGAALVTIIFVLMHIFETFRYWPATVAILMLALATLAVRLRTGSLGPPLVLHAAYNIAIVVYASSLLSLKVT